MQTRAPDAFHIVQTDRFITNRSAMDFEVANFLLAKENPTYDVVSPSKVCAAHIIHCLNRYEGYELRDRLVFPLCTHGKPTFFRP